MEKIYKSPTTGQACTSAQYLAEVLCLREARYKTGGDPGHKFWNNSLKKEYQAQIISVNRLMTEFGEKQVIKFFFTDGKHFWSSGWYHPLSWIKDKIKIYIKKNKDFIMPPPEVVEKEVSTELESVIIPMRKKKKTLFEDLNG